MRCPGAATPGRQLCGSAGRKFRRASACGHGNSVNDSLPTTEYRMCNLAVHLMASSQSILRVFAGAVFCRWLISGGSSLGATRGARRVS
jgi:hypothetical protein